LDVVQWQWNKSNLLDKHLILLLFSHLAIMTKQVHLPGMTPLVIIEDDEKIRNYLVAIISGSGKFDLKASFSSAEEAENYFKEGLGKSIEIVLTDIQLPGKTGIEFTSWLKPLRPDIQFMVLSVYDDADKVFKALKAGASGYVLKNTAADKLIEALTDLHKGASPMSGQIARMVVEAFQHHVPITDVKEILSLREKEVLEWLAKGYRYKEIADKLFISLETVRTHIRNIYEKLHAHNRSEALRKAGIR
jgi:DNA-binding NarL/FixJ family response regulator